MGSTSDEFYRFRPVQATGGCCFCEETPSVVASNQPCLILEPPPEAFPLVGLLGYRFQSCSWEAVKNPPSVVTSDQPCFDTGTSTIGLSTGGTVGGTGSGLYRLPVDAVPVKKPLQWFPVITPFLILEPPPEAFPLVGLLGYWFQSCSCEAVKEPPFSGYQ